MFPHYFAERRSYRRPELTVTHCIAPPGGPDVAASKNRRDELDGSQGCPSGAALAYYSIFSLGPITVIAMAVAGMFFGADAVQREVAASMKGLLGDSGAQAVQTMLAGASKPGEGLMASLIGLGALLFAAIGVVVQLKDALNTVWEVKETEESGVLSAVTYYLWPQ
jgi:uncharacterized BrkB/YihY/UPF0761 family membrane protein